jgi:hypothetical protein
MLTKIGMAVLAGTMATTALAGSASAYEVRVIAPPPPAAAMMARPLPRDHWTVERERQERFERERQTRIERERLERERQARLERERLERERQARFGRERRERDNKLAWERLHHRYADGHGYNR